MREIIGRRRRHDHQEMLSTSPTGVPPPSAMAVSQFSQARSSTGRIIAPYTVTKHPPLQKKKWTKHRKKEGKIKNQLRITNGHQTLPFIRILMCRIGWSQNS